MSRQSFLISFEFLKQVLLLIEKFRELKNTNSRFLTLKSVARVLTVLFSDFYASSDYAFVNVTSNNHSKEFKVKLFRLSKSFQLKEL